jgi:hypothetical protein
MSALPPEADLAEGRHHVRMVPIVEVTRLRGTVSFGMRYASRKASRSALSGSAPVVGRRNRASNVIVCASAAPMES